MTLVEGSVGWSENRERGFTPLKGLMAFMQSMDKLYIQKRNDGRAVGSGKEEKGNETEAEGVNGLGREDVEGNAGD